MNWRNGWRPKRPGGMTPAELAAEVIRDHVPVDGEDAEAGAALEAYFGVGDSGESEPFDIKRVRREAARPNHVEAFDLMP